MRSQPLVSIVTPSFNQGRFLKHTIESVLTQTYPHIEYCVKDGGSTDESVEILKSYTNRLNWISEPDGGQTQAINKGLRNSRGEIRAYLNSDDVLLPHAVERAVNQFLEQPDLDLVYGDALYIDKNGTPTKPYASAEYSLRRLMRDCMICQPAAFWTRRIANKIGPFDESLQWAMDYDYWLRVAQAGGKIAFIPEIIAYSRLYAETKTKSGRNNIFCEIFRVCRQHGGYVHLNYCHGFIDYLIKEKQSPIWSKLMHSEQSICRWSRYFCYLKNAGLLRMPSAIFKHRVFLLEQDRDRARRIMRNPLVWRSVRRFRRAHGVSTDGWLHDLVRLYFPSGSLVIAQDRLWFSGTPSRAMKVTVRINRRKVVVQDLRPHKQIVVSIPVGIKGAADVRIEFSDFLVDRFWRRLSFKLTDSNFITPNAFDDAFYGALPYLA